MKIYKDVLGFLGESCAYYSAKTIWNMWHELEDFEADEYENQEEWYNITMTWMEEIEVF